MARVTKKGKQGETLRIEMCPEGGKHVLTRGTQKYCDLCRPKKTTDALERQRRARSRQAIELPVPVEPVERATQLHVVRDQSPADELQTLIQALRKGSVLIEQEQAGVRARIAVVRNSGRPINGLLNRLEALASLHGLLRVAAERAITLQPPRSSHVDHGA